MKLDELRAMPREELEARVAKLRAEIFQLRFKAATEPITDPGAIRRARKEIARIYTILRERELAEQAGDKPRRKKLSRAARKAARARAAARS
ncbi:MAG: 50S ribosomal protein L29 [Planctomycetota bacterium]|nr:MAG: 50S ribosomal protein L29 [Planctomycetota bacterium]